MTDPRVNILLVDDHRENLLALDAALADLDQNLVHASSGREALKALLQQDFAVVVLDVQMPEMDGFETARLIRSRERSRLTPIIFLTAIDTTNTRVAHGYALGAVDYLFKPFVAEILRAKVGVFVQLAHQKRQLEQEVGQRERAEQEIRQLNQELEGRVRRRTAELQASLERERTFRLAAEEAAHANDALLHAIEMRADEAQFLSEASALLAQSLEPDTTMERLARLLVPRLGEWCVVDVLEADNTVRRVCCAHADSARHAAVQALCRFPASLSDPHGPGQTIRAGRAELISRLTDARVKKLGRSPEHLRALKALQPRSVMFVPMVASGRTLGAITFGAGGDRLPFSQEQFRLAEDVCGRAATALENARLYQEVQWADRQKDQFLAMLAHELRNPLGAISNANHLLSTLGSQEPRPLHLRQVIQHQTEQLRRMVDDLLDVSRFKTGKAKLQPRTLSLAQPVRDAVEATRSFIEQRHHQLVVEVPDQPVYVVADPTRLEQVLCNLLHNAAKYTEPGGQIKISLELADTAEAPSKPPAAVLRVRDTGIGIAPELLPRIFEVFTQADRTIDRAEGGLGLGLALVRTLVEQHHGTIAAHSEGPGQGSEFVIRLPAVQPAEAELEAAGPAPATPERTETPFPQPEPKARKVLVVEDNPDAAETLVDLLELWGYEVCLAGDGVTGVELAKAFRPNVAVLDIGLPGIDGYEVARRLRNLEPGTIPESGPEAGLEAVCPAAELPGSELTARNGVSPLKLIALTGYGQEEDRRRAREAGFDHHFTKPINPLKLRRLLSG